MFWLVIVGEMLVVLIEQLHGNGWCLFQFLPL